MDLLKSRIAGNAGFIIVFIVLFFVYGLHETFFYPPQSVHVWRQTNCLSIAQNYYQHDLPFFEPEIHNQFCDEGLTGKAVGEFPMIYYLVAQLWGLFGQHEWIFKLVQIAIFFSGLFYLFSALRILLKNQFWAGFASLLIFTSPMVVFYGPNFLPDVPALAFVFMAWFLVFKFLEKRKAYNLWLSSLMFCIAMLLKITSAISFIALGGWVVFELLIMNDNERLFRFKLKHFLPFLLVLLPIISWYLYADYYNNTHRGHFSFHGIWPVWNMTMEHFNRVIDALDKIYFKELFLPFTQYLTLAIWLYLIVTIKKLKPILRYFIIVLPMGFLIELMLWFQVLEGHDYYMINLLIVFAAVWGIFLLQMKKLKPVFSILAYALAIGFFIWNVNTCCIRTHARYQGWMNEMFQRDMKALTEIEPSFEKWGINRDDKVISIPDFTINGSLYYMNRKGYTDFGNDFSKEENFDLRIKQGAKYLIVSDSITIKKEVLQNFIKEPIGQYKNIHVFNLQNIKQ